MKISHLALCAAFAIALPVQALANDAQTCKKLDVDGEALEQAIQACTRIIDRPAKPIDATIAKFNRGVHFHSKEDYASAVRDLSDFIRVMRDFPGAYQTRCEAYQFLGKWEEALADAKSILKYEKEKFGRGVAYKYIAQISEQLGKKDDAIAAYRNAIKQGPRFEFLQADVDRLLGKK